MAFKKAIKSESKLRLALAGPAGSGKTFTALLLARELANGRPVAVIDTERGSASKYADLYDFDVLELDNFHPQMYIGAINEAVAGGYAVVVIDSLSHAWNGKGGILEIVQRKNNGIKGWAEVKPIENAFLDMLTGASIHIIATMRTKTEYVVEQDERGKSAPRKVGTAPVQRDGMEYEFDVFGELDQENTLTIHKTRCPALTGAIIAKPGKQIADTLRTWLSGAPAPTPAPATERPEADETRKVVTPQISRDRARLQAEPTADTHITYEESPAEPAHEELETGEDPALEARRIAQRIGLPVAEQSRIRKQFNGDMVKIIAELKRLEKAKAAGYPLERGAQKAAQA